MRDVVVLFPGQGSQSVGMARDLAEAYPVARRVLEEADRVLGLSLSGLMFEGPEAALVSTQNAQPALLAHGAAAWAVTRDALAPAVRAAAGHSLGEFTAYHAAGALALADGLRVVRKRGELMYESGIERPGAMAAILGLPEEQVEAACTAAAGGLGEVVVPANYNAPDQVVISGDATAVERAMALAKAAGAKRALRLRVSGAFHSPLMATAAAGLAAALRMASFADPTFPICANASATLVHDAVRATAQLLEQLVAPVRWTASIRCLADRYPSALFVEMGPGSVLANLVKRIVPGRETAPCGTAADVEQLRARLA